MRILIAVSDRDLLQALSRLLELNGHETAAVFDGIQAVSHMANTHFDAAVLDTKIPRISPEKLLEHLRESNVPAVVLSKKRMEGSLLKERYPENAYLFYPFLPEELKEKLAVLSRPNNSLEPEKKEESEALGNE